MPAKELLRDKDKKFRLLFEDHPQPMWVVDSGSGRFLAANAAAVQLYRYSPEQFRGMSTRDIEVEEQFGSEAALAPPGVRIWRHRTGDGRLIDVEAAVHDTDFNGRPARLAVLLDITGRRRLEDQLRQAQKM